MNEEKNVTKLLSFNPKMYKMILELKDKYAHDTVTATIKACITEVYQKRVEKPAYLGTGVAKETPMDKVKRKEEEKKAKLALEREQYMQILNALGGHVEEIDGHEYAVYKTYNWSAEFDQKIPLHMLTPGILETQYAPTKEKVLELRSKGKKK